MLIVDILRPAATCRLLGSLDIPDTNRVGRNRRPGQHRRWWWATRAAGSTLQASALRIHGQRDADAPRHHQPAESADRRVHAGHPGSTYLPGDSGGEDRRRIPGQRRLPGQRRVAVNGNPVAPAGRSQRPEQPRPSAPSRSPAPCTGSPSRATCCMPPRPAGLSIYQRRPTGQRSRDRFGRRCPHGEPA